MRTFDYSFLHNLPVPEDISCLAASLKGLNALLSQRAQASKALAEQVLARQEEQCASAAVELKGVGFPGYSQALSQVNRAGEEELSLEDILRMHRQLLPEGEAPSSEKAQALGLVLSAYYKAAPDVDPLLLIPCAVLDMLCTSPFPVGSPGAALLAARRLLAGAGFSICRFAPIEKIICRFSFYHQRALALCAGDWAENANAYLPYIEACLSLLYLALRQVEGVFPQPRRLKGDLIRELVLGSPGPISKAEICAALPQVSITTVEAVLGSMVKSGDLRRVGGGRGSRYLKANP